MIETKHLIIDKAKYEDWKDIYHNVWSREETKRYMFWNLTTSEDDARDRMLRTLNYQSEHPYAYFIYLKETMKAIGFCGFHICGEDAVEECGIALGPEYTHRGLGKEVVYGLVDYVFNKLNMKTFVYRCREENEASRKLALSCGFEYVRKYTDEKGIVLLEFTLHKL